jgi:hypothetical protein
LQNVTRRSLSIELRSWIAAGAGGARQFARADQRPPWIAPPHSGKNLVMARIAIQYCAY